MHIAGVFSQFCSYNMEGVFFSLIGLYCMVVNIEGCLLLFLQVGVCLLCPGLKKLDRTIRKPTGKVAGVVEFLPPAAPARGAPRTFSRKGSWTSKSFYLGEFVVFLFLIIFFSLLGCNLARFRRCKSDAAG